MSIASAKAYIDRMREDEDFRRIVNACEDEDANWELLRQNGYEFTIEDFKDAQDVLCKELGIANGVAP